ncbi:hypothetical protein NESM_000817700 [Novymonas esmeraldas]|uniref:Uncharacterized protein n=1 Tax=Novymonas esmeraldas TaxID=1808958 RepID=A0AAW0EW96_9TRYP
MPPLTLEQVLARSMRLPRQRAQRHVTQLYQSAESAMAAGSVSLTGDASLSSAAAVAGIGGGRQTGAAASAHKEKPNFFELMEREEAQRRAGRLSIHSSGRLVRNSTDLTTHLRAAQRTGDWETGLRAFVDATALHALETVLTDSPAAAAGSSASHAPAPPSASGVNPTLSHINTLLDTCAAAGKWELVEKISIYFAPAFPDAFSHAMELVARRQPETAAGPDAAERGWRGAFVYLTTRCPLPAAEVPVEAFHVCLRGCEAVLDWRGAMEVVRAMGPNPLQGWRDAEEGDSDGERRAASSAELASTATAETGSADATSDGMQRSSSSAPPPPNAVTYAMLLATLEQAGKDSLASAVLNRLPALEKEEITASYAALIMVWSNQVLRRQRRRF